MKMKLKKQAVLEAIKFVTIAARTAPKSGGKDDVFTKVAVGREEDVIADTMSEMGNERKMRSSNEMQEMLGIQKRAHIHWGN